MRRRTGRAGCSLVLGMALLTAAVGATPERPGSALVAAGLNFDHLSRTATWAGDTGSTRMSSTLVTARAALGLDKGVTFSLFAGLSLTDFGGLAFTDLPVTLEFQAAPVKGLLLGGELDAPVINFGKFEIEATGRFVFSFGMSKAWPLEGFAVPGEAKGRPDWMEAAAGPRISYRSRGGFVPYIEVDALWFQADFRMTETLADLKVTEIKKMRGDFSIGASLGGELKLSPRLTARAEAGVRPYPGGVDGQATIGLFYLF